MLVARLCSPLATKYVLQNAHWCACRCRHALWGRGWTMASGVTLDQFHAFVTQGLSTASVRTFVALCKDLLGQQWWDGTLPAAAGNPWVSWYGRLYLAQQTLDLVERLPATGWANVPTEIASIRDDLLGRLGDPLPIRCLSITDTISHPDIRSAIYELPKLEEKQAAFGVWKQLWRACVGALLHECGLVPGATEDMLDCLCTRHNEDGCARWREQRQLAVVRKGKARTFQLLLLAYMCDRDDTGLKVPDDVIQCIRYWMHQMTASTGVESWDGGFVWND
jgi:hypothetical protein